jgi:hypothetical protein
VDAVEIAQRHGCAARVRRKVAPVVKDTHQ